MKKIRILGVLFCMLMSAVCFTACSSDDDDDSSELSSLIIGKWRIVMVEQEDGSMFDVTSSIAEQVFKPTYATFNSDGTFSGYGFFGYGSGTYKVKGNKIFTYIDGEDFLIYTAESYTATRATLVISAKGEKTTIRVVVEKQ